MTKGEKINYTNYLQDKPQETDPAKLAVTKKKLSQALKEQGIRFQDISCTYYADGSVLIYLDGEYYNVFNSNTGKFFSGYVGDGPDSRA